MEFKFLIVMIALVPFATCYSEGAPDAECLTMTPRHHVEPQKTTFPYNIVLSKNVLKGGETIKITIQGKSSEDTIKGIFVQARVGDTPVGSFDTTPSSQYLQLRDCGNSKGSAVTHKKITNGVQSVTMLWTAPKNLSEKIQIYATVARNGGIFWTNQKSSEITVKS